MGSKMALRDFTELVGKKFFVKDATSKVYILDKPFQEPFDGLIWLIGHDTETDETVRVRADAVVKFFGPGVKMGVHDYVPFYGTVVHSDAYPGLEFVLLEAYVKTTSTIFLRATDIQSGQDCHFLAVGATLTGQESTVEEIKEEPDVVVAEQELQEETDEAVEDVFDTFGGDEYWKEDES